MGKKANFNGGPFLPQTRSKILSIETETGQRIEVGGWVKYKREEEARVQAIEIPEDRKMNGEFRIILETPHGDFLSSINSDFADQYITPISSIIYTKDEPPQNDVYVYIAGTIKNPNTVVGCPYIHKEHWGYDVFHSYGEANQFLAKRHHVSRHWERIECPKCEREMDAVVEHTHPHWSRVHHCEYCGEIIMESEWNKVEKFGKVGQAIGKSPEV